MENLIMKFVAVSTGVMGLLACYLVGYIHAQVKLVDNLERKIKGEEKR